MLQESAPQPAPAPVKAPRRRGLLKKLGLALLILVGVLLAVGLGATLWFRSKLQASLPRLQGEAALAGLAAPVAVERDAQGIPVLRGSSRLDVARATGFVHAQDRFFQMDTLRRRSAGEMAELLGEAALENDLNFRLHRFRQQARHKLTEVPPRERALIEAYTEGVNAGLASLGAKPFEYYVLGQDPAPWTPEDTLLVVYSLFTHLQDWQAVYESGLGLMHDTLPRPLFDFLVPTSTPWDAPIAGQSDPLVPIPPPSVIDLRRAPAPQPAPATSVQPREPRPTTTGSNSWAVAGERSETGAALLANTLHVGLNVPNLWYRASFVWPGADGRERRITGITLPGTPMMVLGSNGQIAWGFTNSLADTIDLVVIEPDPSDPERYLTPEGPRRFERFQEKLRVRGGEERTLDVVSTVWGPILRTDPKGRKQAMRWTAYEKGAVGLATLDLEEAGDVATALDAAARSGMPTQNFLVVDAAGTIGWTISGFLPKRAGFDGRLPTSWADGQRRWEGRLAPEDYPRVVQPESGRLWTANNRVVAGEMLAKVGDGGYYLGARAQQIRDRLLALDKASAQEMMALHLDDEARFFHPWRDLLLKALTPEAVAADPRRADFRKLLAAWDGRASVDSVGFRLIRAFRLSITDLTLDPLVAPCVQLDERFDYYNVGLEYDYPLWTLLTERPPHLLNPRFRTWDEQILAGVDGAIDALLQDGGTLAEKTWGQRNTSSIRHLFSPAIPFAGRWLDMPPQPLAGDEHLPLSQSPISGDSVRMVVSPGREREGILQMPTGQSGHPLSPHYSDMHEAWYEGRPTPFLPGEPANTLRLVPVGK